MFFKECVKIINIDFNNKKSLNYFEAICLEVTMSNLFIVTFLLCIPLVFRKICLYLSIGRRCI